MIGWILLGIVLLIILFVLIRVISNMQSGSGGEGWFIGGIRKIKGKIDDCCGSLRGE